MKNYLILHIFLLASYHSSSLKASEIANDIPAQNYRERKAVCINKVTALFSDWKVVQSDQEPSVIIGRQKGYRTLLQKTRKEYLNVHQQEPSDPNAYDNLDFVLLSSHIDLILFPSPVDRPEQLKKEIPWSEIEQEYFTRPVYIGRSGDFDWFVNTTIYYQEYLRDKLALEGGDDRLQLLTDGLYIKDKGSSTTNSVERLLAEAQDKAIPYIRQAVEEHINSEPENGVRPLAYMYSEQALQLLKRYYALPQTRNAAAYALIHKPYRKQAKTEYIDMLIQRVQVHYALEACVEFDWKEALPHIRQLYSKPDYWRMCYDAFIAKRILEENPVPQDILDAQNAIFKLGWSPDTTRDENIQPLINIILHSPDKEAATIIALNIAFFQTKGNGRTTEMINETGWDILRELPPQITKSIIRPLIDSMNSYNEKSNQKKLREFIEMN